MSKRGRGTDGEREAEVRSAMELIRDAAVEASEAEGLSLTPLERQVASLKEVLPPHVILMVACGYRVKFYGRDSRVISRRSGIMCIPAQPFEYSSVPYTRVDYYIRRLVAMGYHVGFADQESAAVRAVEGVKSGVFQRAVSQLYSRGTLLPNERIATMGSESISATATTGAADDDGEGDGEGDGSKEATPATVLESGADHKGADASELFICFLRTGSSRPSRGGDDSSAPLELVLVSFVTRRCECFSITTALGLEDVLQRFDIVEVVVIVSARPLAGNGSTQGQMGAYLGCLPEKYATVLQHTLPLHLGPTANGEEDDKSVSVCGYVYTPPSPPPPPKPWLASSGGAAEMNAAIEAYLAPYKLDKLFKSITTTIRSEASAAASSDVASTMERHTAAAQLSNLALPGSSLRALDIFHSSSGRAGSLLGLLGNSMTPCGARKLRAWLTSPLASRVAIIERQEAVAFFVKGGGDGQLNDMLRECGHGGDAEATIGKLYAGRCGVTEYTRLLRMVRAAHAIAKELLGGAGEVRPPPVLMALLSCVASDTVSQFIAAHAVEADSTATTPVELFTGKGRAAADTPPAIQEQLAARDRAMRSLEIELESVRGVLKMPGLEYRSIGGTPFLIDVPAGKADRALKDWTVITRTKSNVRYHTPAIVEGNIALCAARDRLVAAASAAWQEEQSRLSADDTTQRVLAEVVDSIAVLDALRSLSILSARPGYVAPTLVEAAAPDATAETTGVKIVGGRHPVLDARMAGAYVSCDVSITSGGTWLLTGPNMGGKSALMRMVGCFVVLSQLGCFVPAVSASLPVFAGLYCRMGSSDSLLEGSSTFLVEMEETSRILGAPRLASSLVLMDELGRGTSSFDGVAVAAATLEYLVAKGATTIFVTHYSYLCDPYVAPASAVSIAASEGAGTGGASAFAKPKVECYYMGFREEVVEGTGNAEERRRLVFTYRPTRGVTPSSFGVDIATMAGLPESVTGEARKLSAQQEKIQTQRMSLPLIARFLSKNDS